MDEAIDDHDGFVMWVVDARRFDDGVRLWWDANMMCWGRSRPAVGELQLLFDDAPFAFGLGDLACAGRCYLACLHKFADVSGCC